MAQMTDRLALDEARPLADAAEDGRRAAPVPPPEGLTWAATLDGTREIEITDEMVRSAIAAMEGEQVYPFRRERGAPPPVARAVRKADVIAFPGTGDAGVS